MKPTLALKIDVDTWRGTREGVPNLVNILRRYQANATFLFSLGPDHTGRAIKRALRPGFMQKVGRTSVVEHYGIKTLLFGTLLPGPDIGKSCADILRSVHEAGFECGIHCWDHVKWQDGVEHASVAWTEQEMTSAVSRFTEVFGFAPRTHGAAGWQMNRHAVRLEQKFNFLYASDGRGSSPFLPVCDGELINCPQIPTTLPTLDELIGVDGITVETVADHLLNITAESLRTEAAPLHVYTLHAELEGQKLLPVFDKLLAGWLAQGYALSSVESVAHSFNLHELPRIDFRRGEIPGRSGTLMVQGSPFP